MCLSTKRKLSFQRADLHLLKIDYTRCWARNLTNNFRTLLLMIWYKNILQFVYCIGFGTSDSARTRTLMQVPQKCKITGGSRGCETLLCSCSSTPERPVLKNLTSQILSLVLSCAACRLPLHIGDSQQSLWTEVVSAHFSPADLSRCAAIFRLLFCKNLHTDMTFLYNLLEFFSTSTSNCSFQILAEEDLYSACATAGRHWVII